MANDLNYCSFIGRLGADPETRYMPNGDPVCSFRIAVGWKTKDKEGAEWVSITAFGKLAEICNQYLKKGSQVFISGRLKTDVSEKNGVKSYFTKIVADRMQMLGVRQESSDAGKTSTPQQPARNSQAAAPGFDGMDDDIPFRDPLAGPLWRVI